jgi:hypothetical protein
VLSVLLEDDVSFGSYIMYMDADREDVVGYAMHVVETMDQRGRDFAIQQSKGLEEKERTQRRYF